MRYARKVDFNLKTGQEKEFNKIFESKIVPMLQKQKGFQEELILAAGREITAISLWDTKANADGYDKTAYPKILETIKPFIEATPKVKFCEVPVSTFHAAV